VPLPAPLPDPLVDLVAHRFRVLGEPARIRLLDALRSGPAGVTELGERVGLSQQNASKHLGVLASAGLVERTRAGNTVLYAISDPSVFTLCEVVCDALRDRLAALHAVLPVATQRPPTRSSAVAAGRQAEPGRATSGTDE
jgi:DNA-binding transcriptional ArsR family regulator